MRGHALSYTNIWTYLKQGRHKTVSFSIQQVLKCLIRTLKLQHLRYIESAVVVLHLLSFFVECFTVKHVYGPRGRTARTHWCLALHAHSHEKLDILQHRMKSNPWQSTLGEPFVLKPYLECLTQIWQQTSLKWPFDTQHPMRVLSDSTFVFMITLFSVSFQLLCHEIFVFCVL